MLSGVGFLCFFIQGLICGYAEYCVESAGADVRWPGVGTSYFEFVLTGGQFVRHEEHQSTFGMQGQDLYPCLGAVFLVDEEDALGFFLRVEFEVLTVYLANAAWSQRLVRLG